MPLTPTLSPQGRGEGAERATKRTVSFRNRYVRIHRLRKNDMTTATAKKPAFTDYIVKDISLAEFGRKEISLAEAGIPVFAVKGESLEEYWNYTAKLFDWHGGGTPNMILDDGGDATMFVHQGVRAERGDSVFLDQHNSEEEEVFFALIKRMLKEKPKGWFSEIAKNIKGVSEETTTGVHRLYDME